MENFKTNCILATISKIMELTVAKHLTPLFVDTEILTFQQLGFRKRFSISDAFLDFVNTFRESLYIWKYNRRFCDPSYAFDLVDYKIIILKQKG